MRIHLSVLCMMTATLALTLVGCGSGGGSAGAPTTPTTPTTPVTSVTINGTTFNLASCHDFSTTPVGALFERPNMYRIYGSSSTVSRIYEQVTGTTVGGVAIVGWFDGEESVWAVDTAGAIRQIGEGVRTVNGVTVTLADRISQGVVLPTFLPGGTLVNGQTFAPRLGFGRVTSPGAAATATITLNVLSRNMGIMCTRVLIVTPILNPYTQVITMRYDEIWIPSGLGVLRQETYQLLNAEYMPLEGFIYQAPSV